MDKVSGELWLTLLQQQAWAFSPALHAPGRSATSRADSEPLAGLHGPALSAMSQLAAACGLPSAAALTAVHAPELMASILQASTLAPVHVIQCDHT